MRLLKNRKRFIDALNSACLRVKRRKPAGSNGWLSPYKFGYNLGLSAQYHSINGFFQINHQAAFGKTQSGIIQRHQAILTIVLVSTQRQGGVVGVVEVYRQGNLLLLVARLGVVFGNI